MKTTNYFLVLLCLFSVTATFAFTDVSLENRTCAEQEPTPTIIELLQEGESYAIEITSVGCFNGSRQTISVFRENGEFKAYFQDNILLLTEKDIEAFIDFEEQLRGLDLGACTTVDTYILQYRNEKFKTSDGTCSWNGGKKLLQYLGFA